MRVTVLFYILFLSVADLICVLPAVSQQSIIVQGTVSDSKSGERLVGATVSMKDRLTGTVTDKEGAFRLTGVLEDSLKLLFSYVGYETAEVSVRSADEYLHILLTENAIIGNEVVVSASRINEKILEAPVTVLKVDAIAVRETPSENFYASLGNYKGVDVLTNSILYKTINTRGFNNNANFRLIQLVDGVDNSLPGLGWAFGNVLGVPDIDVASAELIPGVASALYGANAFNGLLSITTKDPFNYPGLSFMVKNGINHLGNSQVDPALYADLQLRLAHAFNNRFAFKATFGYTDGSDWLVTDSTDINPDVPESVRGPDNPARNAVNIYGDDVPGKVIVSGPNPFPVAVSRTGYYLKDLVNSRSYSLKANASVYYKITDRMEVSYALSYAQATTTWSNLFYLKNMSMLTNKLELRGTHYFLQTAVVSDDLGETYNMLALAGAINRDWQKNQIWYSRFASAYNGNVPGVDSFDFNAARVYADSGRFLPGSEAFQNSLDSLADVPLENEGAKVIDHSSKWYFEGQYDFSQHIRIFDLIAGADYRITNLKSEGTIFTDSIGQPIQIHQYAGYAQATKKLYGDKLKLLAALRYDKADNFDGVWAPRFAAVYHPDEKNYFRASYQTGFRLPDPQLQYIDIDLTNVHRLGGTEVVDEPYNVHGDSFTGESVDEYLGLVNAYLANPNHTNDIAGAADTFFHILKKSDYDYIQPEKVHSFEVGYQRLLFDGKIYADVNYFHNEYANFIYTTTLVQTDSGNTLHTDSIKAAAYKIAQKSFERFSIVVNSSEKVVEDGIEVGASFVLPKGFILGGNFTWIHSNVTPEKEVPSLRTPPFKSNVSISNRNAYKNLGFMINWRWTDAINVWSEALVVDNSLPACNIIDAQISYRVRQSGTSFKLGASNLLNFYHQDFAQGPSIGGLYYISLLYDGIFDLAER